MLRAAPSFRRLMFGFLLCCSVSHLWFWSFDSGLELGQRKRVRTIVDPVIGTAHRVRLSHQRFLNYCFLLIVRFFVNHSLEMSFQFPSF